MVRGYALIKQDMPYINKPKGNSPKTSYRRKSNKDVHRKKIAKSPIKSTRLRRDHGDLRIGMTLNTKLQNLNKYRVGSASKKGTNHNRILTSNYNKNVIRKHDNGTVKRKNKEFFMHQTPKKIRKRTNNGQKTQASTEDTNKNAKRKKSFGLNSNGQIKLFKELKTLLLATLDKSEQNYYAKNQYRNNDFDQVSFTNLNESVSYPKFVYDNGNERYSNNRYGKEDNRKKSEPLENEQDLLPWWTEKKGTTTELQSNYSKLNTCPETRSHSTKGLREGRVPSSLDCCHANSSKARSCKTKTKLNVKAHPENDDNCYFDGISTNKLICKINIEIDRMRNDKYHDHLDANSDDMATIIKANNDHSHLFRELNIDDYTDGMSKRTKEKMKYKFVKACDLVFDAFKDKVFDTVYSEYLASVCNIHRLLHD